MAFDHTLSSVDITIFGSSGDWKVHDFSFSIWNLNFVKCQGHSWSQEDENWSHMTLNRPRNLQNFTKYVCLLSSEKVTLNTALYKIHFSVTIAMKMAVFASRKVVSMFLCQESKLKVSLVLTNLTVSNVWMFHPGILAEVIKVSYHCLTSEQEEA